VATLTLAGPTLDSQPADAVVVGTFATPGGPVLAPGGDQVDQALGGRLREALVALGATGAEGEVVKVATLGISGIPVVVAAGLGSAEGSVAGGGNADLPATRTTGGSAVSAESVRRAAGAASRALAGRATVISTLAAVAGPVTADLVRAAGEGSLLGAYAFTEYRTGPRPLAPPGAVSLLVPDPKDRTLRAAIRRAVAVGAAVTLCRDLVNTAPNDLPPAGLADRAAAACQRAGLEVEILDEKALRRGGYGGIVAVGGGSTRPPRLARIRHRGPKAVTRVAMVGKGITFDSGGLSIKPAAGMDLMKSDMAGAAAVIATMTLVAALKLPLDVIATVPMAENLPGGAAYRPSDVLTMYGGKRVEVLNTDAEGRLILADAIVRAGEDDPAYLIETSTLTGAQRIALGDRVAGVMGSERFRDQVVAAGARAGEGMWAMPLPPELRPALDSRVADLANVAADRTGGMLAAGVFLREFVPPGLSWAHIDIAGPAFNAGDPWGYTPKGGTGVPVRTLLAVLEELAGTG